MATSLTIAAAARILQRGGVIAYPTEAVWGLGCDPFNETAVLRLLALKQRAVDKGLILIAGTLEQFDGLLDWSALPCDRSEAVYASWPGPHTWIVPVRDRVPPWITGAHDGVAVRISAHPVVVALCAAFAGPLVSTSANPSGMASPRTLDALDPPLRAQLDGVVAGDVGDLTQPTSIRDARTGRVLRGN